MEDQTPESESSADDSHEEQPGYVNCQEAHVEPVGAAVVKGDAVDLAGIDWSCVLAQ